MNELIKYFEALEARLAAQEERIAKLEKMFGDNMPMLEEMQRNAEEIKGHLAAMQQILDQAMQAQAEPDVEVELVYPEDEEATVELPKEETVSAESAEQAEEEQPVVEEPKVVEPEPVAEPAPQPVVEEPKVEEVHQEEAPKQEAPRVPQQASLFGTPVTDIRQAVSIGDRFLFQRELFGGNAEKLQQTLTELNGLHSLDDAVAFVDQFGWDKQSSTYELFLNVLRRRFQ